MQRILVERARGALRQQAGFTLVELLVTVGIIVALAAVIVPSVVIFSDKGDTGAKAAETDNVQVAMDTMMADTGIFSVTALGSGDLSSKTWTALPAGVGAAPLSGYLREDQTAYTYCWDSTGKITEQFDAAPA